MADKKIYLDHAATTPIDDEVYEAMFPYMKEHFGNPSSVHQFGQKALIAVDRAKQDIAKTLSANSSEIYFTSSATESNNLAIEGTVRAWKKKNHNSKTKPHIIVSSIEHPSVLEIAKHLERSRQSDVSYIQVDSEGFVKLKDLEAAIRDNTILVSVMYANNEIGTIQSIEEIGKFIAEKNSKRQTGREIYFHTDAVQAFYYLDCNVSKLGVDLLSLSGHKIYGPKGIGVLFVRDRTPIEPLFYGGGQQDGIRPGTLPVFLIVGMAKACELAYRNRDKQVKHIKSLSEYFITKVLKEFPEARLNGSREKRIPSNIHLSFPWVQGDSMLMALDIEGIAVSTGSACSSGSVKPSHVLTAIGLEQRYKNSSLRITLGQKNTKEELDRVIEVIKRIRERLKR